MPHNSNAALFNSKDLTQWQAILLQNMFHFWYHPSCNMEFKPLWSSVYYVRYTCVHVHVYVHVHVNTRVHVHVCTCIYVHMHIHVCMHIMCVHVCRYMHTFVFSEFFIVDHVKYSFILMFLFISIQCCLCYFNMLPQIRKRKLTAFFKPSLSCLSLFVSVQSSHLHL
jgi:hypothetical protein